MYPKKGLNGNSASVLPTWVCGISATQFSGWFMGLHNKLPPAVEAKPACESAKDLKLK